MSARLSAFICGKLSSFDSGDHVRCPDHRRTLGSNCHREPAPTAGSRTIQIGGAHFAALCRCTLSQTPPGGKRFVANKDLSVIRPSGDRTVEVPFPHFFRAPIVVNFGPVFSFRVSGRQRVVGPCLAHDWPPIFWFSKIFLAARLGGLSIVTFWHFRGFWQSQKFTY
jgi:hypothetical protein